MFEPVARAYRQFEAARPLVRPTYNQFEVTLLPPYGDPEVYIPTEVGTYILAALLVNAVLERVADEAQ